VTKPQARKRLHFWIRVLGLQTWDFEIIWGGHINDENPNALVTPDDDYMRATIHYSDRWRQWDARKFDQVTVHELLHCVLNEMDVAQKSVHDALSHDAKVMLQRRYRHEEERAVQWLASRIVDIERGQAG
jgi:hypothetical protein